MLTDTLKRTLIRWWDFFIYKPDIREIYWGKVIPSLVVLGGFILVLFFNNKRVDKLKIERFTFARYTIGVTTGQRNNMKGSMWIDYSFNFTNEKFTNSEGTHKRFFGKPNTNGGRYYVRFALINPNNSELLFDNPVPDNVENAPDSGWTSLPSIKQ